MLASWARTSRNSNRSDGRARDAAGPRPELRPHPANPAWRRWDREVLAASIAIVGMASLLEVGAEDRVTLRGRPEFALPQVCAARAALGVGCPACGLTRSLIHLARGDLTASRKSHRLGWLLGGVILAQIPYRWTAPRPGRLARLSPGAECLVVAVLLALLLANWLLGIAVVRAPSAGPAP